MSQPTAHHAFGRPFAGRRRGGGARARGRAAPHLRDHLAPRRRQDDADREAAAVRGRDRAGRRRARPQGPPARDVRLDGARAAARHLDHVRRARVRARRAAHVAPRHAGPQGLQRRHVSRAHRRRQRGDGDRRGQRRRGADAQAVRGVPPAPAADSHLHQQVRPSGEGSARAAGRYRAHARHRRGAGELADRQRRARSAACTTSGSQTLLRYEREAQGQYRAPVDVSSLDDPDAQRAHRRRARTRTSASRSTSIARGRHAVRRRRVSRRPPDAGVLRQRADQLRPRAVPAGAGRARAAAAAARRATRAWSSPTDERFTGFVFKIQANMDPRHRDRVAFVRVCSGPVREGHDAAPTAASGKPLRASRAYRFFGRDRETIERRVRRRHHRPRQPRASSPSATRSTRARRCGFPDVPRFPAEHFGRVRLQDTRYKQFDEGLRQLEEEGLMQVFYVTSRPPRADRRRRRRAAVRRDRQPPAERVRRGRRRSSRCPTPPRDGWRTRPSRCRRSGRQTVAGRRPARAARASSSRSEWELQYFERHHPEVTLARRVAGGGPRLAGRPRSAGLQTCGGLSNGRTEVLPNESRGGA